MNNINRTDDYFARAYTAYTYIQNIFNLINKSIII